MINTIETRGTELSLDNNSFLINYNHKLQQQSVITKDTVPKFPFKWLQMAISN